MQKNRKRISLEIGLPVAFCCRFSVIKHCGVGAYLGSTMEKNSTWTGYFFHHTDFKSAAENSELPNRFPIEINEKQFVGRFHGCVGTLMQNTCRITHKKTVK